MRFTRSKNFYCCRYATAEALTRCFTRSKNFYCCRCVYQSKTCTCFTRSKNFYCCRYKFNVNIRCVSRAQKISTVVDGEPVCAYSAVSRAQKISTVVDNCSPLYCRPCFTRSKNFYCCRCIGRVARLRSFHALKKFLLL